VTAGTGTPQLAAAAIPAIPLRSRIIGFGSIYGKTIRDSRLAFIIAAGLLGGMSLVIGAAIGTVFPTPETRHDLNALVGAMPPAMVNLFGNATLMGDKLGTLGGYATWKYGSTFALGTALWSILALSGTLAGEAARGSLDLVATSPFGKRRIALEKLAAHLTALWITMAILAIALFVSSNAFGDAALGDPIPLVGTVGFALWVGFLAMCFGGLAFALAPALGRGGSAAVAGIAMVALWVMSGLEVGGPLVNLSPFHWTADHIPLVEIYDWAGLALVGVVGVAFLAIGVVAFDRRDLGVTSGFSLPSLPAPVLGVRGPISRAFGDQLPRALAWGLGMAVWGALLGSLVGSFSDLIKQNPDMGSVFAQIFPNYDFSTAGGWLQLYAEIFYIAAGFAAATFVAKWASDETEGRLESVLTTPLTRSRWVVAGGVAALVSAILIAVLFALGTALGAASGGSTAGDALLGSLSLGLYAAAVVGIGVAIGGLWRTSLAAEIAALFVVATFLIDLLAPPLGLPDWVHQLALTAHVGQPMIGNWDPVGIVLCVAIAVGGVAIGAIGMRRRDVVR
jgi:polyether ionophore transport system permease protein